jgi:hypothetical protein
LLDVFGISLRGVFQAVEDGFLLWNSVYRLAASVGVGEVGLESPRRWRRVKRTDQQDTTAATAVSLWGKIAVSRVESWFRDGESSFLTVETANFNL